MVEEFTSHTSICAKKSKFAERVQNEGKLPCSFCCNNLKFDEATTHMEDMHPEVIFDFFVTIHKIFKLSTFFSN